MSVPFYSEHKEPKVTRDIFGNILLFRYVVGMFLIKMIFKGEIFGRAPTSLLQKINCFYIKFHGALLDLKLTDFDCFNKTLCNSLSSRHNMNMNKNFKVKCLSLCWALGA